MGAWRAAAALTVALLGAGLAGCASGGPDHHVTVVRKAPVPASAAEVDWRAHFPDLSRGAILVRLDERRLSFWSPDGERYREYPIAVAEQPEFERLGATAITARRAQPDWRPTPSMLERNPDLPRYVGPGPDNPMGEHALYLGWPHYAIHGTNDPVSIGRATTSGCIRLFPEHIAWLYAHAQVGTPVQVVRERAAAS
ncbi:MAG: L,D-transpeptidase [Caulobacterales bacterium]|nr:L,D-transpeptidase [Caulobacterales bacterium]